MAPFMLFGDRGLIIQYMVRKDFETRQILVEMSFCSIDQSMKVSGELVFKDRSNVVDEFETMTSGRLIFCAARLIVESPTLFSPSSKMAKRFGRIELRDDGVQYAFVPRS